MPSYAAIRTDKSSTPLILRELEAGRLRQGWGWEDYHDLRLLRAKRQAGQPLEGDEHEAWLNRRLYEETWDGLQDGDIVVLPNLPEQGQWLLARIDGPYRFDRTGDCHSHGHVRPVQLIRTPAGEPAVVHPTYWEVPAGLRRSMRTPRRMWTLDQYGSAIDAILRKIEAGAPTHTPTDAEQRLDLFAEKLRAQSYALIDQVFGGVELEHLVVRMLRARYRSSHPQAQVIHKGGPAEHGIDVLIKLPDPLGVDLEIGVQVKKHDGHEWSEHSLTQLRHAREHWGIHAGVVITTAEATTKAFDAACNELQDELKIPIRVIVRDELVDMVLAHLGDGTVE